MLTALLMVVASEGEIAGLIVGLIAAAIISLLTWFSCLTWEAIAEIIQLLEDIKNK